MKVDSETVSDASGADRRVLVVDSVHPASNDQGPLNNERDKQQRETDAAVAVALQERHQEAEAEQSDGMQVLEERVVLQALARVVLAKHAEQDDEDDLEGQEQDWQQELEVALLDGYSLVNEAVLVGGWSRCGRSWRYRRGLGLRHHGHGSLLGRHGRDHHLGLVHGGACRLLRALAGRGGRLGRSSSVLLQEGSGGILRRILLLRHRLEFVWLYGY